jgi:hypothetical protein
MEVTLSREDREMIDKAHAAVMAAPLDLCSIWRELSPYWSGITKLAALIPVVGWIIAGLMKALGIAMDVCCPKTSGVSVTDTRDADERELEEAFESVFGVTAGAKPCCNIWNKVKKYWSRIVDFIRKHLSEKVAEMLDRLGKALDQFCRGEVSAS